MIETNIASESYLVVQQIEKILSDRFKILCNVDTPQYYIGGLFPDVIVMDKATDKILFAIEVKKSGQLPNCILQWKNLSSLPATLYIVVPKAELNNAKGIAAINGLKAKFGYYTISPNDGQNEVMVHFE